MAEVVVKTIFKLKRGNSANWATQNPLLEAGEPGFELDTGKLKVGNGVARWNDLKYIGGGDIGVDVDGLSIIIDKVGRITLAGFAEAQAGYSLRKTATGALEWYNPVTKEELNRIELRVQNMENTIGDAESGLIFAVNSMRAEITNIQTRLGDTYTKAEVNTQINTAVAEKLAGAGLTLIKVSNISDIDLTAEDAGKHIYLVPKESEADDIYDEYIVVDGKLEHLGTTSITLADYVKIEEFTPVKTKVDSAPATVITGVDKVEAAQDGILIALSKHQLKEDGSAYEQGEAEEIKIPLATSTSAGAISKEDKAKLDKIDPDATATVTGAIVAGETVEVTDHKIIIPVAGEKAGVIKSSEEISEVTVKNDGTAEVKKLGVDRLENVEGIELILCAGGAESV